MEYNDAGDGSSLAGFLNKDWESEEPSDEEDVGFVDESASMPRPVQEISFVKREADLFSGNLWYKDTVRLL